MRVTTVARKQLMLTWEWFDY